MWNAFFFFLEPSRENDNVRWACWIMYSKTWLMHVLQRAAVCINTPASFFFIAHTICTFQDGAALLLSLWLFQWNENVRASSLMTHKNSNNNNIVINAVNVLTFSGCCCKVPLATTVYFMPLVISVAASTVNKWSDKQKLRWKEDLKTHLIWLTSNAPPDVVSKCELTSFACSISEMHRSKYEASSWIVGKNLSLSDLLVSWSNNWHLNIIKIYVLILRKIYSSN